MQMVFCHHQQHQSIALIFLALEQKYFNQEELINGDLFVEILRGEFRPEMYPYDDRKLLYDCLTSILMGLKNDQAECEIDLSCIEKTIADLENITSELKNN